MMLRARLLLYLGRVQEGSNDRRRSDTDRNTGLHQLGPALFARLVSVVSHGLLCMASKPGWEAV